ncbi:MAG: 16S rRNA (adenine(1518)-N(6)/adenine(1519)-N(6))-dimethyltransferase RsmA [Micrococcales bacterium]|nr:16S rRNA (adenine(1518)-N(6)/adenine(1519)-N(6))-dimethyltransferase RsmA [Micrococcales bacterium]
MNAHLLSPSDVRALCSELQLHPNKALGQNFVVDPGIVTKIVRLADAGPSVVEVGPGLGSLTLALLQAGHNVTAIEIDPVLADQLPVTVSSKAPGLVNNLTVVKADALQLSQLPGSDGPTALVANLPYKVAVPVLLTYLERFRAIAKALVMVQAEVAERLVAGPGSRTYGVPSAKLAWWASSQLVGTVPRNAFFPVPRVDSALVLAERRATPTTSASYSQVSKVIEAAFGQRRKTLRSALAGLAGGPVAAEAALRVARIDPGLRGERLGIGDFARLAEALNE